MKGKLPDESPSPTKILMIHSYAKPPSDSSQYKNDNETTTNDEKRETDKLASKNAKLKREIKTLQQKVRRRNFEIKNMMQIIDELEKKLLIKTDEASLLHNNIDGLQLSVFKNTLKKDNKKNMVIDIQKM